MYTLVDKVARELATVRDENDVDDDSVHWINGCDNADIFDEVMVVLDGELNDRNHF